MKIRRIPRRGRNLRTSARACHGIGIPGSRNSFIHQTFFSQRTCVFPPFDIRCCLLVVGCWMLDVECCLFAIFPRCGIRAPAFSPRRANIPANRDISGRLRTSAPACVLECGGRDTAFFYGRESYLPQGSYVLNQFTIGCWMLSVGCWTLAIGYCLLAIFLQCSIRAPAFSSRRANFPAGRDIR